MRCCLAASTSCLKRACRFTFNCFSVGMALLMAFFTFAGRKYASSPLSSLPSNQPVVLFHYLIVGEPRVELVVVDDAPHEMFVESR